MWLNEAQVQNAPNNQLFREICRRTKIASKFEGIVQRCRFLRECEMVNHRQSRAKRDWSGERKGRARNRELTHRLLRPSEQANLS